MLVTIVNSKLDYGGQIFNCPQKVWLGYSVVSVSTFSPIFLGQYVGGEFQIIFISTTGLLCNIRVYSAHQEDILFMISCFTGHMKFNQDPVWIVMLVQPINDWGAKLKTLLNFWLNMLLLKMQEVYKQIWIDFFCISASKSSDQRNLSFSLNLILTTLIISCSGI